MTESTPTPPSDFGSYFAPAATASTTPAPGPQFVPPSPQFGGVPMQVGAPAYGAAALPAPAARNWTPIIAAAVAVVVLAVGGYAWFGRSSHHSLSTPATIAGYQLMSDPTMDSLKQSLVDQVQDAAGIKKMTMGVYRLGALPSALVIAVQPKHHVGAAFDGMNAAFQSDATSGITPVDAGPLGGDMDCGVITTASASPVMCVWRDDDTIGVIGLFYQSMTEAPPLAVQFRDAVEH